MDQRIYQQETNTIATDAYVSLRNISGSMHDFQRLEELLANNIYNSEKMIQQMRTQGILSIEEEFYRRRTLLKRVADGLAWHLLQYDTHAISGCSIGRSAGFMYGKDGYKAERKFVNQVCQLPNLRGIIQCDITNILHLADVIIARNDGFVLTIEIKGNSSQKNSRAIRQKHRYNEITTFLKEGQNNTVNINGFPFRTIKAELTFRNYWDELDDLVSKAINNGFSWKLLDECVFLAVADLHLNNNPSIFYNSLSQINWQKPQLIISSLGRHLEKNLPLVPSTCLPITLFPIEIAHGIELINGRVDAFIGVNIKEMVSRLRTNGINATITDNHEVMVEKGNLTYSIGNGAWSKLLNELVTVPSFLEYLCKSDDLLLKEYKD